MITLNKKEKLDKISFELNNEVKEILYKELKIAQDITSMFYLSKRTEYSMYHCKLDSYFKFKNIKNKPSKTDYLAWILLLTYPENKIRQFQKIDDLNIYFKDENLDKTDFEIIELYSKLADDIATNNTCVCGTPIENIYKLKNKFTEINIQVGCECIERYGLVSKNEIGECKKKMKEHKERQKEIEEGKPIGYYKEQRENDKLLKDQIKKEKEQQKQNKLNEKIKKNEEKQRQNEEKLMTIEDKFVKNAQITCCYKKCLLCKRESLYNRYNKVNICNICVNSKSKLQKYSLNQYIIYNKREYKENECLNCDNKFVYNYKGKINDFCSACETKYKKTKCKLCSNEFIDNINSFDLYCNDCDEKIKDCFMCKNKYIPKNKFYKYCDLCYYRVNNNLTVINCQECDEEVEIKNNETWRKFCKDCFKTNLKFVNCEQCSIPFKRLLTDNWRKTCQDCYYKSK
jgi:hypothetical protein